MTGRIARVLASLVMLYAAWPAMAPAQPAPAASDAVTFNTEQLDALLAPVALYPDALLTQVLMASTFPLQVVEASRWLDDPTNKALSGDALTQALAAQSWDPSVKSLVPFPSVLGLLNSNLEWTQQLGYAFTTEQAAVFDSVQRLRRQAQAAGNLQSTPQQVVRTEAQTIIIEPAQPTVVYVPSYNPAVVYGAWPYPAYPPVYLPPLYPVGTALVAGLMFGAGVAITAGLWGWARPSWGYGRVDVNVNTYNTINVNRPPLGAGGWQAGGGVNRPPAGALRPPGGPVGRPARPSGLPAGAIGRPEVSVPGSAVRPPARPTTPPATGTTRPGPGSGAGQGGGAQRPNAPGPGSQRPVTPGQGVQRPGQGGGAPAVNRPLPRGPGNAGPGAFSGVNQGRQAGQFDQRGAQSRAQQQRAPQAPAHQAPRAPAPNQSGGGRSNARR